MALKNYSPEFRRQAVDLYKSTLRGISADLGVSRHTLYDWVVHADDTPTTASGVAAAGVCVLPVPAEDLKGTSTPNAPPPGRDRVHRAGQRVRDARRLRVGGLTGAARHDPRPPGTAS
jgi:transposase-like protein